MPFEERFQLLVESGQANKQSVAATRSTLDMVEQHYGIQLTEELGASLVSHLAITLKRLLDGESLLKAPDAVWQELEDYPEEVTLADSIVRELERRLRLPITRDEVGFIALHLCRIRIDVGSQCYA